MLAFVTVSAIFTNLVAGYEDYHIINPSSNITCPTSIDGTCFIECSGNWTTSQCKGITMNCGNASTCTIICDTNSCSESTIINQNVNIMNLYMSGSSFNDSSIFTNMLHKDSIININCFHNSSSKSLIQNSLNCYNINWKFMSYNETNIGTVYINCNSPASCSNANIFAETINYLWFNCSNPICMLSLNTLCVCTNMNISTPIFGNTEILMTQENTKNIPSLNIFNIQGYNNIDLIGSIFPETRTSIHCGLLYESRCDVTLTDNDTWNCSNDNYLCLGGNDIYDSDKISLQIPIPNIMIETKNESIYTNVNCEDNKSCYIYPQSLVPLVMNVSNVYRFNCAEKQNCTVVYCTEICRNMIIIGNNANNAFINCNHYSNSIISDCSNSNISATNTIVISLMFYEFYDFNAIHSFSNSTIYAMNVSLLQIDGYHYYSENLTVYGSLKYYDGRNGAFMECERCSYSNVYYLNNINENKGDYLYINCNSQTSCNELTVYYDLNKHNGCNMVWRAAANSFVCNPFDNENEPYDDSWWTYTLFIPVAVIIMVGSVYIYRAFCIKKDVRPKTLGYGAISDV